jgi:hypothetical protein
LNGGGAPIFCFGCKGLLLDEGGGGGGKDDLPPPKGLRAGAGFYVFANESSYEPSSSSNKPFYLAPPEIDGKPG